jgi:glycogen debranching enzyme
MKGCLGQVAEIFDAEAPFEPRGCIAQAWGTAEWLRALDRASEAPRAPALPPTREETRSA